MYTVQQNYIQYVVINLFLLSHVMLYFLVRHELGLRLVKFEAFNNYTGTPKNLNVNQFLKVIHLSFQL